MFVRVASMSAVFAKVTRRRTVLPDVSQCCQPHALCKATILQHQRRIEGIKTKYTHKVSLSSKNQRWKDHAVPVTDDVANIKTEKAVTDVFQVAWITSIDSFDIGGKPLFCNGRRFWGGWVFPLCNTPKAKRRTAALRTLVGTRTMTTELQLSHGGRKQIRAATRFCHASD